MSHSAFVRWLPLDCVLGFAAVVIAALAFS
jgi:hypothetical protein